MLQFKLLPVEYINSVVGSVKTFRGETCIAKLEFKTNLGKKYGPLGKGGGIEFTVPVVEGQIVGFFGQSGSFLNGIGVVLPPESSHPCGQSLGGGRGDPNPSYRPSLRPHGTTGTSRAPMTLLFRLWPAIVIPPLFLISALAPSSISSVLDWHELWLEKGVADLDLCFDKDCTMGG
ncbi:hypothetical protein ZIOFF_033409 [Zingiber officinale]|uniref:Jacalin-type lectin domain-containing protein n=1 Tax=Zingiber officinale TaxID=94328 RepID=A0A8J5L1S5_ZINOF|nr:hypothetical protein ZIOFF_033409 [Zingiber officinale]